MKGEGVSDASRYVMYGSGFFYKDDDGVVWHVFKTSYKEIPITLLELSDPSLGSK